MPAACQIQVVDATPAPIAAQAGTDARLIELWLAGKSPQSRRTYTTDIVAFRAFVAKPLRQVARGDVKAFRDSLGSLAPASQARRVKAVKSLISFGHTLGYLASNVGALVKAPAVRDRLAERILDERSVSEMICGEPNPRNRALLRLMYYGGLRVSEVCGLRVRDLQPRDEAGQVRVFGKGGQVRIVPLPATAWRDLEPLRTADPIAPVFRSREGGGPLDPSRVHQIVKAAAARAGLSGKVSAQWLRHAHISHALGHGAPARLVQVRMGHASLATTSRYARLKPGGSTSCYLPS